MSKKPIADKCKFKVIEGIDSGGEDGIHVFTKSDAMKEVMADTKLAKVSQIIDQVMFMANKQSKKFSMGIEETKKQMKQVR